MLRIHQRNSRVRHGCGQQYNSPSSKVAIFRSRDRTNARSPLSYLLAFIAKTIFAGAVFLVFMLFPDSALETSHDNEQIWGIEKHHLAESIADEVAANEYPSLVRIANDRYNFDAIVHYNIEPKFNIYIDDLIAKYGPDYAAVVALQPHTGRILAMSSFVRDNSLGHNLAVHSEFPAASIFKIITAAAAIDTGVAKPDTIYPYNGKTTSLYKSNVLRHKNNKWTRNTSLSRAFALSINTVFGRIGVFDVGAEKLRYYADRFGFNGPVPVDFSLAASKTRFRADDEWSIAEAASGYTRETTISPVHAAMLAAVIANDGVLIEPNLIDFAVDMSGPLIYKSEPTAVRILDEQTTEQLRVLMRATVKRGSARKHFQSFFRGAYSKIDVGGKTGSLTGNSPQGRTEWFVGYANSDTDKIAVAAVVVNKEKWRVKPARLARMVIEEYFRPAPRS